MKRLTFIIIVAVLGLLPLLPISAQQKQDVLYVYRNDGRFHGFFYDEIERISYSKIDTFGLEQDDYVVQEIYARDTIYRIPVSAIDSVSFITPEPVYQPGVITPASDMWSYVVASDTLTTFVLSPSIPQSLIPKVGDRLANTTATPFLPHGFYGEVASISIVANGTEVKCDKAELGDLFVRYVGKYAGFGIASDDYGVRGVNRSSEYEPYEADIPMVPIILGMTLGKNGLSIGDFLYKDVSITGEGTFMFQFRPKLRIRAFIDYTWLGAFNFDLTTRLEAPLDYNLHLDAELSLTKDIRPSDLNIPHLAIPLGQTPFFFEYEPGLTLGLAGKIKIDKDWHYVERAYGAIQATNLSESDGGSSWMAGDIRCIDNRFVASAAGSLSLNAGLYSELNFTLVTKDYLRLGIRLESGLKAQVDAELPATAMEKLRHYPIPIMDTPTLYQFLNTDDPIKIGPYAQGKIIFNVFNWSKNWTFFDEQKDWFFKGGIVPKFPVVRWEPNPKQGWRGRVVSYVDRKLVNPVDVGLMLYDVSKKEFYQHWTHRTPYKHPADFRSYEFDYEFLQPSKNYRVYPTVMMESPFKSFLLADEYVDFTLGPPSITFKPNNKLEVPPFSGSMQMEVLTNMYNTEMKEPTNASWLTASYIKEDADLKIYYDEMPEDINERKGAIHFIGRDSLNVEELVHDSIVVTQVRAFIEAPKSVEFDVKGGIQKVAIKTNLENIILSFSELGGNKKFYTATYDAQAKELIIVVPENTTGQELVGSITLKGSSPGGQNVETYISITQNALPPNPNYYKFIQSEFEFMPAEGSIEVTSECNFYWYYMNYRYSYTVNGDDKHEWFIIKPKEYGDADANGIYRDTWTVSVEENTWPFDREAVVTFLFFNKERTDSAYTTIYIYQEMEPIAFPGKFDEVHLRISAGPLKYHSEYNETHSTFTWENTTEVKDKEDSAMDWSGTFDKVNVTKGKNRMSISGHFSYEEKKSSEQDASQGGKYLLNSDKMGSGHINLIISDIIGLQHKTPEGGASWRANYFEESKASGISFESNSREVYSSSHSFDPEWENETRNYDESGSVTAKLEFVSVSEDPWGRYRWKWEGNDVSISKFVQHYSSVHTGLRDGDYWDEDKHAHIHVYDNYTRKNSISSELNMGAKGYIEVVLIGYLPDDAAVQMRVPKQMQTEITEGRFVR